MKQNNHHPLHRLLRSAAAAPAAPDVATSVPWSLEQRVLAALRSHRQTEDLFWVAPLLRRAFSAAGALALVVGFLAFHQPAESANNSAPSHELAVMDQELTLVLVPNSRVP
jgi:hypothetical protein